MAHRARHRRSRVAVRHAAAGTLVVLWTLALLGRGRLVAQDGVDPASANLTLAPLQAAVVRVIDRVEESVVAIGRARLRADRLIDTDAAPDYVEYLTGVIVDPTGLILTNYHALGDVANSQYTVWRPSGEQYVAKVRAADPWTDLALLQIEVDQLPALPLGQAEPLRKGEFVVALGNPYAILRDGSVSASWGIVSNRRSSERRSTESAEPRTETIHEYGNLIETDAKLKLGTSGGPLVNLEGEMVGLQTNAAAIFGYDVAASYAIPVDAGFRRVLERLKNGQEVEFGFLGVQVDPVAPVDDNLSSQGVRVVHIVRGTHAAASGLRLQDRITAVDGEQVTDPDEFLGRIGIRAPGASVRLTVHRRDSLLGRERTLTVEVLLSKKYLNPRRPAVVTRPGRIWRGLRVDYSTAVPDLMSHLDQIDPEGCVAVVDVRAGSPAWQAGLRPITFISHVNQDRVATPTEFWEAVDRSSAVVSLRQTGADDTATLWTVFAPEPTSGSN